MPTIPKNFRLARLNFTTIGHGIGLNSEAIDECYALFGNDVASGDEYLLRFFNLVEAAIHNHQELPIVRMADGEFAFYRKSIKVNGLYQQTRGEQDIIQALPYHIACLQRISQIGLLCPITYLYNISWVTLYECATFWDFLESINASLTPSNYLPFYAIYAALTSLTFMTLIDHKDVLIVSDQFVPQALDSWNAQFHVTPNYKFVSIPSQYVSTDWLSYRDSTLAEIRNIGNVDLVMVAAGAGAVPVCHDVARELQVPVIDSGHVINLMMNNAARSGGHRLFCFRGGR